MALSVEQTAPVSARLIESLTSALTSCVVVDGQVIRLSFPQLTEERRKELVKVVKHKAEEGRVAVRNLRRSARHELEALEKEGHVSSDDLEWSEKELDKLTHDYVEEIDRMVQHKEHELLEV